MSELGWGSRIGAIALVVLMGSCGWLSGRTTVQQIKTQRNIGETVSVEGTVGDRVPLIEAQVYELQDATGSIWVLTPAPVPEPGTPVRIEATVRYQEIQLLGQDQGEVYLEQME